MKIVVQRVKYANVKVDGKVVGSINNGFLLLVGISREDNKETCLKLANKICKLRIFDDEDGKMNLDINKVNGEILSISQFTLYADAKKGNRPSFINAQDPSIAKDLYLYFNSCIRGNGIKCEEGIFGAEMQVELLNDGPITIILDSKEVL